VTKSASFGHNPVLIDDLILLIIKPDPDVVRDGIIADRALIKF